MFQAQIGWPCLAVQPLLNSGTSLVHELDRRRRKKLWQKGKEAGREIPQFARSGDEAFNGMTRAEPVEEQFGTAGNGRLMRLDEEVDGP